MSRGGNGGWDLGFAVRACSCSYAWQADGGDGGRELTKLEVKREARVMRVYVRLCVSRSCSFWITRG